MRLSPVALAAFCLAPKTALAQADPLDTRAMMARMTEYFEGERQQSYVFLGYGLGALGVGAYLVTRDDPIARGAGYPTLAFGLLQTLVGASLAVRTSGQIADRQRRLADDPAGFARDERTRMKGVMARFTIAQGTEIALAGVGLGLFAYGALRHEPTFEGVGLGVAVQSVVTLGLEYLATKRGGHYLDHLTSFTPPAGHGALGAAWQMNF